MKLVLDRWLFWRFLVPAAVVVGGVSSVILTGDIFGSCTSAVLSTLASPDGKRSIVIFRKQCKATVPYSTQASIAPADITSAADKIPAFFIISGTPDVTANWRGNRAVEIAVVAAGEKVFRKQETVGDITIDYK